MSSHDDLFHSDGNGLIRKEAMLKLLETLPHLSADKLANISVVQIRYAGAKGILVPWESRLLEGVVAESGTGGCFPFDVVLRKSMVKFDAPFRFLEVCR
jgi:hypothetical protein